MTTQFIDIGPKTWADAIGLLIVVLESGDAKGKQMARAELTRMAKIADMAVAQQQEAGR